MDVSGKVAIVTGAAGGIGAALAQRLVEAGARVVASDLDAARLEDTVAALAEAHAGRIIALAGDAASSEDIAALVAAAAREFGPVDLYFANAGVPGGAEIGDEAAWDLALDVNVRGHVRAAQQLVPGWTERGEGYFVSTASAAGLLTQIGSATYSVSKHAAVAFAEWLSVTYGHQGVRVSCLCPMGVNTAMLNSGAQSDVEIERRMAQAVLEAGSVVEPLEVADLVLTAVQDETFLVLPHPEVLSMWQRKGTDYDRWLAGMRRYQDSLQS